MKNKYEIIESNNILKFFIIIITLLFITGMCLSLLMFQNIKYKKQILFLNKKYNINTVNSLNDKISDYKEQIFNLKFAFVISKYYKVNYNVDVSKEDLLILLDTIKNQNIISDLPFSNIEMLAFPMTETHFDNSKVGNAGEIGMWQILDPDPYVKKYNLNPFDVRDNSKIALMILRDKYKHHKNKRKAIIAYNGIIYKNGVLIDKYYKKFKGNKKILQGLKKEVKNI